MQRCKFMGGQKVTTTKIEYLIVFRAFNFNFQPLLIGGFLQNFLQNNASAPIFFYLYHNFLQFIWKSTFFEPRAFRQLQPNVGQRKFTLAKIFNWIPNNRACQRGRKWKIGRKKQPPRKHIHKMCNSSERFCWPIKIISAVVGGFSLLSLSWFGFFFWQQHQHLKYADWWLFICNTFYIVRDYGRKGRKFVASGEEARGRLTVSGTTVTWVTKGFSFTAPANTERFIDVIWCNNKQ